MIRFSFKKKITAEKQSPIDVETLLLKKERENKNTGPAVKTPKEKIDEREEYLSQPFAVHSGNPYSQTSNDPNAEQGAWHFAHHSILGNDENGDSISSSLKAALDHPDSGYEKVTISPDQYGSNTDLLKLAPKGMTGYKPKSTTRTRTDSEPLRVFHTILNSGITRRNMRSRTSDMPTLNAPAFEPTHPLNLIATHGGEMALQKMFTDTVSHAPATPEHNLCVCGRSADKHVDAETAKSHHAKTGEHLEIHEFTPQFVHDEQGNPTRGSEFRASQSLLRRGNVVVTDEKGERTIKNKKVDDVIPAEENLSKGRTTIDPETGESSLTFKKEKDNAQMPLIRVGAEPVKINEIGTLEPVTPGKTDKINIYDEQPEAEYSQKKCKNPNCHNGVIDPWKREHRISCRDCLPGKVKFKMTKDSNGETKPVPFTEGLGGGRMRYFHLDDAPDCPHCKGEGKVLSKDKTATDQKINCSACNATGKQIETMGEAGFKCPNCESKNSSILTTPSNSCPDCNGTGYEGAPTLVDKSKKKNIISRINKIEGNPLHLSRFSSESVPTLTGIDGWKGHGNPDCTRCHGDDEYQTEDGLPCNCRIGSFTGKDLISPSDANYISPSHVDIPAHLYDSAMKKAYPDDSENPHVIKDLRKTTKAQKAGLGRRYVDDNGKELKNYLYMWENGVSLPKETIESLNKSSAKNRASRNAKFCAASADLEDISKAIGNFSSLPINISTDAYDRFAESMKDVQRTDKEPKAIEPVKQPSIESPKVETNT
jgi:hypothetical protein